MICKIRDFLLYKDRFLLYDKNKIRKSKDLHRQLLEKRFREQNILRMEDYDELPNARFRY